MEFDEHDVAIPLAVLEELDEFKKGNDTKNYEAREFIRFLDKKAGNRTINNWINLNGPGKGKFKVVMAPKVPEELDATKLFGSSKNDHKILNAALHLQIEEPARKVILVTKDINLRLKAKSLNVAAEDFLTGKIQNVQGLHRGREILTGVPHKLITLRYAPGCGGRWQGFYQNNPRAQPVLHHENGKIQLFGFLPRAHTNA
jgi:PhoH-like ATPase